MNYLWVALGSALGGVARFGCGELALRLIGPSFPWGTLFVNVLGSLLIGMLAPLALLSEGWLSLPQARAFLIVGVCGGFTTFSSFSIETLNLARTGDSLLAITYVLASVLLCLLAVAIGYYLMSTVFR